MNQKTLTNSINKEEYLQKFKSTNQAKQLEARQNQ
jgi:hypothetical protein